MRQAELHFSRIMSGLLSSVSKIMNIMTNISISERKIMMPQVITRITFVNPLLAGGDQLETDSADSPEQTREGQKRFLLRERERERV